MILLQSNRRLTSSALPVWRQRSSSGSWLDRSSESVRFGGKAFDWTIFHTTPADRRIPVGSCAVFTKVFMRLIAAVFYYVAAPTVHRPFSIQPAYTREGRVCFSLILRTGLASRRQCSVTALGLQSPEATARSRNPDSPESLHNDDECRASFSA